MLTKKVKKIFFMRNKDHGDDHNTFNKVMFDIDFEKWLDARSQKLTLYTRTKFGP